ncbi:phosphoglycerate kinase [Parachlamydia sp. AcF125]|uniref:phosphoglycerate kinase n=1 Tax=Parachlamydia sp. AcF125 TaxID=2795736 RepID=UPI001BC901CF|nr:phosphoglycerate kinase [Parachlamydia sp. AcF125]MBS4167566.1 Bifunctional PGK/TIM [Parachlamydia sp. AcF125]
MSSKLSLSQLPLNGKKVLVRVDFNVPLDKEQKITDDTRIRASLPTIRYILEKGGAVILMSHLGRPKGKPSSEYSLKPCAKRLSELLNYPVLMAPDSVGEETRQLASSLKPTQVLLLENLRFREGEEYPEKDPTFAKELASLGDLYVNDAFGTAHRAHASTAQITRYFPGKSAAGFLLEKEIKYLNSSLIHPSRPFCAIIGGSKISTKIGVIQSLLQKADAILIGGGMAYTFLKAQGIPIGNSIHEEEFLDKAKSILHLSSSRHAKIILPDDLMIADSLSKEATVQTIAAQTGIPSPFQGVDIGPQTIQKFAKILQSATTIFWNGPLGVFEIEPFAKGTYAIARIVAESSATTIVGGGDSIAALQASGLSEKITHLSTGGGASLEYIEQGTLPGIEALSDTAL